MRIVKLMDNVKTFVGFASRLGNLQILTIAEMLIVSLLLGRI